MKNLFYKLIFLIITILITACGSKIPFIEEKISKNNALVYLYVSGNIGSSDLMNNSSYTIRINSKNIKQKIKMDEYLVFEMKPNNTKISIVRRVIEQKTIELNLIAGGIYYLRVDTNLDSDTFSLQEVDNSIALSEIKKTALAGSIAVNEKQIITEIVDSIDNDSKNMSKSDEVKKAYKLKVEGILTQEEYSKLKAEILSK